MLLRIVAEFANENQSLIHALRSDSSDRKAVSAQGLLTNRTTSKREPPVRSDKGGFCDISEQSRPHRSTRTSRPREGPPPVRGVAETTV